MKFGQIAKRVLLFTATNLLVVITISIVLSLLGVNRRMGSSNYQTLLVFCLVWGFAGAFISLALSRLMAKWSMGVQVIPPDTDDPAAGRLVQLVHELAQNARLPEMPEVGVYDSPEVNAFATGPSRRRSLVAVSSGLLQQMDAGEVRGVLAHEVAHIANGDMVTMTLLQGVINAFVMFFARIAAFALSSALRRSDDDRPNYFFESIMIVIFEVVFSVLGMIVVCAFSRWREFRADAGGARYGGKGNMVGALRALKQLHDDPGSGPQRGGAFAAFKISGGGMLALLSTHPPLEKRIEALERLA